MHIIAFLSPAAEATEVSHGEGLHLTGVPLGRDKLFLVPQRWRWRRRWGARGGVDEGREMGLVGWGALKEFIFQVYKAESTPSSSDHMCGQSEANKDDADPSMVIPPCLILADKQSTFIVLLDCFCFPVGVIGLILMTVK